MNILTTVYHKPTETFYTVTEEEAEVITNMNLFILACKSTPYQRAYTSPKGLIRMSYWCSIGEVTQEEIRNQDYIKLPDTPAARVLFGAYK